VRRAPASASSASTPHTQEKKSGGGGDLARRLAVAAVGIPAGFAVVWSGGWVLASILAVLGIIGAHEVLGFARARGIRPFPLLSLPATLALILLAPIAADGWSSWTSAALGILLATGLLGLVGAVFRRGAGGHPLAAVAVTLLAPLYVGVPLAAGWFLRHHPASDWTHFGWAGTGLLLLVMISTWFGDTTAYFGGRSIGGPKLLPSVSPAKTVSGSLSGLAGSVLMATLVAGFLLPRFGGGESLSLPAAALFGLLLGMAGQVGDLAESLLKREAGVKDSGALLPGHGGVLDRFDAVLFTLPLAWYLLPFFLR
jgi:phosphatidate cytidylyltransferase